VFSRLDDWHQTSYMIWCRIWWLLLPFRTLYRGLQGRVTLCSADTACFDPEAPKASCTIPCGHFVELVKVDACSISNSLDLTHNSKLQLLVATAGLAHCLRCYMFTVAFAWNFQKPRRSLHPPTSRRNSGVNMTRNFYYETKHRVILPEKTYIHSYINIVF